MIEKNDLLKLFESFNKNPDVVLKQIRGKYLICNETAPIALRVIEVSEDEARAFVFDELLEKVQAVGCVNIIDNVSVWTRRAARQKGVALPGALESNTGNFVLFKCPDDLEFIDDRCEHASLMSALWVRGIYV